MQQQKGKLYLIPSRLGDDPTFPVLPVAISHIIERLDYFIVENEKTARRFIKQVVPTKSQPSLQLFTLNKRTTDAERSTYLNACKKGISVGLLSEAGCPAIADPGAKIVEQAHQNDIKVVPLVGPSSIILALMASGMNGQNFTFNGYIPIDKTERKKQIKTLEKLSEHYNQAQIFIETPYRNNTLLGDLINTLQSTTKLCIACDITLPTEYIVTKTVQEWKTTRKEDLHKRPCIFILQKN